MIVPIGGAYSPLAYLTDVEINRAALIETGNMGRKIG